MALVALIYLLQLASSNQLQIVSQLSLSASCTVNGDTTVYGVSIHKGWSNIIGANWIWHSDENSAGETCVISGITLDVGNDATILLAVSADDEATLIVNGVTTDFTTTSWNSVDFIDVTQYFPEPGTYDISFSVTNDWFRAGLIYKFIENYSCDDSCSECNNPLQCTTCAVENANANGSQCFCPSNSVEVEGACACLDGYTLSVDANNQYTCAACLADDTTCIYGTNIYVDVDVEGVNSPDIDIYVDIEGTGTYNVIDTGDNSNVHIYYGDHSSTQLANLHSKEASQASTSYGLFILYAGLLLIGSM